MIFINPVRDSTDLGQEATGAPLNL